MVRRNGTVNWFVDSNLECYNCFKTTLIFQCDNKYFCTECGQWVNLIKLGDK